MLKPEAAAPALTVALADGAPWDLRAERPEALTVVAFYRGAFCRFCRAFVEELDVLATEFDRRGLLITAISMDTAEEARRMAYSLKSGLVRIGYGLSLDDARAFGLFVSRVERQGRATMFAEPALFLIRPSGAIYAIFQNSMSCGRPDLRSIIEAIDMVGPAGFPSRGEF